MTATGPVGSLATEAGLLLDVVAERLRAVVAAAGDATAAGDAAAPGDASVAGDPIASDDAAAAADDSATAGDAPAAAGHATASDGRTGSISGDTGGAEPHECRCTGCPICRLLGILRGERPEVGARWAEGALQVIGGLRTLLENHGGATGGGHEGAHSAPDTPGNPADPTVSPNHGMPERGPSAAAPPVSKVQHIDVE